MVRGIPSNKHNIMYIIKSLISAVTGDSPAKRVVFGIYHDSILNHIPTEASEIHILNIDHHHDLYYKDFQLLEALEYGECSESNWILPISDRISEYTWVGNNNSEEFVGNLDKFPIYTTYIDDPLIEEKIKNTKWDLVYIALSPNYTADEHWFYFFMLIEIYKGITGKEEVHVDSTRPTPLLDVFNKYEKYDKNI